MRNIYLLFCLYFIRETKLGFTMYFRSIVRKSYPHFHSGGFLGGSAAASCTNWIVYHVHLSKTKGCLPYQSFFMFMWPCDDHFPADPDEPMEENDGHLRPQTWSWQRISFRCLDIRPTPINHRSCGIITHNCSHDLIWLLKPTYTNFSTDLCSLLKEDCVGFGDGTV